jgi:CheY-like chemotaxis protein
MKQTILLAENDEESRDKGCFALRRSGYSVVVAKDGKEVFRLLEAGVRPALICLGRDVQAMADAGCSTTLRTEGWFSRIPIVVLPRKAQLRIVKRDAAPADDTSLDECQLIEDVDRFCPARAA